MNRIAVLAAKYVQDPAVAVEDIARFWNRVGELVQYNEQHKEWRYLVAREEMYSFYGEVSDCIQSVGLAKERQPMLADFCAQTWDAFLLSLNPLCNSIPSANRPAFSVLRWNAYDNLKRLETKMELARLLDIEGKERKGRGRSKKSGRPPKARLTKQQLEAIHKRVLDQQSLRSIYEWYKGDGFLYTYHTFRRLYHAFRDEHQKRQRTEMRKSR